MKEFKLKNKETVSLFNSLTKITMFSFPGVLKIHNNIFSIKGVISDINDQYREILYKHFKNDLTVIDNSLMEEKNIPISIYDVTKYSVMITDGFKKDHKLKLGLDNINNKEVKIELEELDVSLPVFLFEDKIKLVLKDYLEQIIRPIDLLFYPEKIGIIKNLF